MEEQGRSHSLLERLGLQHYLLAVKATLTSEGQITIPLAIRDKFHLKPGDVLEFDENSPFLKATKSIAPEAWNDFGKRWTDPWPTLSPEAVLDDLRGEVSLPPE